MPGSLSAPPARAITIRVQVQEGTARVVREIPLEEYVTATALSEVHPDVADAASAERMFEVQAVLARTYAVVNRGRHAKDGFDLCSTTHCQLYEPAPLTTSRWAPNAAAAGGGRAGPTGGGGGPRGGGGGGRGGGGVLCCGGAPARGFFVGAGGGRPGDAWGVGGVSAVPSRAAAGGGGPADHAHADWTFETA